MEENNLKTNLNLLKEIVLDEERLVTYLSISKELCIHVNDAKLLLQQVVEDIMKELPDVSLNITYLVSGLSNTNGGCVTICSDTELQDVRDSFTAVFFVHIYSVIKGSKSLDKAAFMATNKFEDFRLCTGSIKNECCFKRTADEIGTLKSHSQEVVTNNKSQTVSIEQKDSKTAKVINKHGHEEIANAVQERDIEKPSMIKVKQEEISPKNKTQSTSKPVDRKNSSKTTKGIAGYFSKANGVENTKTNKTIKESAQNIKENVEEKKVEIKSEKLGHKSTSAKLENLSIKENGYKDVSVNSTKTKKTINPTKSNAKVDKKRKRVLHVSDSESDNDENDPFTEQMAVDNESEDEIPPTPTVTTVKITSGMVNPKKKRKIVDKTYTDEDGYILTKKEEVYESCSDKEEETEKKENIENKVNNKPAIKIEVSPKTKTAKVAKKKISPPQKGKQAMMTNFFKKV